MLVNIAAAVLVLVLAFLVATWIASGATWADLRYFVLYLIGRGGSTAARFDAWPGDEAPGHADPADSAAA